MDVQDLLKTPQLFAVKKGGRLQLSGGLADNEWSLKAGYLFSVHHVMGCGNPDCDCIDKAWEHHCSDCEVVEVELVERVKA